MSFKEVRELVEDLKLLGYPNAVPLISLAVNNGCLASFQLVAAILQWLAALLEPGTVLAGGVSSREERVLLIRSAIEYFMLKWNLKLNPRKLYAASSVSAGELQKITRLIITPATWEELPDPNDEDGDPLTQQVDLGDRINDLRKAREISSELTRKGAILNDLLLKEVHNKEMRITQGNRSIELAVVEHSLKNAVLVTRDKVETSRTQMENARLELNALNSKLQRKKSELERNKQRLEALQKIRPAHMQEFEQYENELKVLFQEYFQRVHIRDALKEQLEIRHRKSNPMVTPIIVQKPSDQSMSLISEGILLDNDEEIEDGDDEGDQSLMMEMDSLNIRDEDYTARNINPNSKVSLNRRPGTATVSARLRRPSTADRNRMRATATIRRHDASMHPLEQMNVRGKEIRPSDNSSLGSSDSNLDMSEFLGMVDNAFNNEDSQLEAASKTTAKSKRDRQNTADLSLDVRDEDDNDDDLNSMESISISKIAAGLPLHPKSMLAKMKQQSDEDF